ncbi:hypothetical protein TeGR_g8422 [Tetraparma gracilis]|uniref:Uncharacterized protein n=1 Tax=Tetraparma gracilis TaxID=2962635 RepID=A0ABQ6MWZ7_9STRA|nr:hypothetical protein TeGR_g8422 [Tetraparma gracilis]
MLQTSLLLAALLAFASAFSSVPLAFTGHPDALAEQARKLREEAAALEGKDVEAAAEAAPEKPPKTLYDDEGLYDDRIEPRKETMSDGMKDKLRREAQGLGSDPNAKGTNLIAIILLAVGVLVAVGGQGILF